MANVEDVTKAKQVKTPEVPKMTADPLNSYGPGRFSPTEDDE